MEMTKDMAQWPGVQVYACCTLGFQLQRRVVTGTLKAVALEGPKHLEVTLVVSGNCRVQAVVY